jgi:hypothetical protein
VVCGERGLLFSVTANSLIALREVLGLELESPGSANESHPRQSIQRKGEGNIASSRGPDFGIWNGLIVSCLFSEPHPIILELILEWPANPRRTS